MDQRIQSLMDRLPELDHAEDKLKHESGSCAYPALTDAGEVQILVSNAPRLAEIQAEMRAIREERVTIQDRLSRLKQIPLVYWPDGDFHNRRRREYASRFFNKICCEGQRTTLTPEEGISDPRYAALKSEFEPEFEAYRNQLKRAKEYEARVNAILRE